MEFLGCYSKSKGGGKSKRGDVLPGFTANIDLKCAVFCSPRFIAYRKMDTMLTICFHQLF